MCHRGSEILLKEILKITEFTQYWGSTIQNTILELESNRLMTREFGYTGKYINVTFSNLLDIELKIMSSFIPKVIIDCGKIIDKKDVLNANGVIWFRHELEFETKPVICIELGNSHLFTYCDLDEFLNMI